jgi:hypothetical protein
MAQIHTIDDLPRDKAVKADAAVAKFTAKKRKTRDDELDLYDTLTNLGVSSEGADEYINMLLESN